MKLRAVFLDVGNTLLHEVPSRFAIYAEVARARGLSATPASMRTAMQVAHSALPRELEGAFRFSDAWFEAFIHDVFHRQLGLAEERVEEVAKELFARFESADTFRLYPGALELIEELRRRGIEVGIISNWSARLPRVLSAVGLAESVAPVLCSALEGMEKPEPEIFLAAAERAGVAPAEALHAGDHPEKDVRGALAVGMQAVWVDHDRRTEEAAPPEAPRVHGLPELAALILGRLRGRSP